MSLINRLRSLIGAKTGKNKASMWTAGSLGRRNRIMPSALRPLRMECLEERTVLSVTLPLMADLAADGPVITVAPIVASVTPSVPTITSANAGPDGFNLLIDFDQAMNTTVFPTVSFPTFGENPTANTLFNPTNEWLDADTFRVTYDVFASQERIDAIDVQVSGGLNVLGEFQAPQLFLNVFSVDTVQAGAPGVLSVTPFVTPSTPGRVTIKDANVGPGGFTLRIIYDVTMDQTVLPEISFPTPGEDPEQFTLQNPRGEWSDSRTFVMTYDVAPNELVGVEEVLPDVDVLVEGGRSIFGVPQTPTLVPDVFTVDTAEPTVAVTADGGLQGLVGQPLQFTFTATSDFPVVQDGLFTYRIKWGDGTQQNLIDRPATVTASHVFTTSGVKILSVIVEDQFDVQSVAPVTLRLTIVNAIQDGPDVLLAGTPGNDRFTLARGALPTVFLVSMNNSLLGRFTVGPAGQIQIFGRGGIDTVVVRGTAGANLFAATATGLTLDGTIIDASDITTFQLNGNGGADTLVGVLDVANTFRLTGLRSGILNDRFRFSGIQNLTGGIDADTFIVTGAARGFGTVDGAGGIDVLDFSALARAFTVNLKTATAPGIRRFINVEDVIGNNRTSTLVSPSTADTFLVDGPNTGTVAGIRFSRFNRLIGAPITIV